MYVIDIGDIPDQPHKRGSSVAIGPKSNRPAVAGIHRLDKSVLDAPVGGPRARPVSAFTISE
jgi:hypothetical protein